MYLLPESAAVMDRSRSIHWDQLWSIFQSLHISIDVRHLLNECVEKVLLKESVTHTTLGPLRLR